VLGVAPHLVLVAAGGLFLSAWALPVLAAADRPAIASPRVSAEDVGPRVPTSLLVVLGAIAGCTAFGEGALTDWGALLLRQQLAAPATLAAAGYGGFSLAMALGRLFGGRLLLAWGERRLLVGGTLLAAVGALAAVTTSELWVALAGFVVVGLGLANVFPLAVARAGMLGGAQGIALATTVGYTGLLGGPPAIGLIAQHLGLAAAVGTVSVLSLVAAVLVVTVSGDRVQVPAVVSGARRGAGSYVRDLDLLVLR
jgi:MFS family permease